MKLTQSSRNFGAVSETWGLAINLFIKMVVNKLDRLEKMFFFVTKQDILFSKLLTFIVPLPAGSWPAILRVFVFPDFGLFPSRKE